MKNGPHEDSQCHFIKKKKTKKQLRDPFNSPYDFEASSVRNSEYALSHSVTVILGIGTVIIFVL